MKNCKITFVFFIIFAAFCTFFKLFIPVLKIIGFLNLDISSINGKLLHSPEPILNAFTPILFKR